VHGAIESGRRAAQEILQACGDQSGNLRRGGCREAAGRQIAGPHGF
jgi:hypothetical protein